MLIVPGGSLTTGAGPGGGTGVASCLCGAGAAAFGADACTVIGAAHRLAASAAAIKRFLLAFFISTKENYSTGGAGLFYAFSIRLCGFCQQKSVGIGEKTAVRRTTKVALLGEISEMVESDSGE
jgi:hypothetical protein